MQSQSPTADAPDFEVPFDDPEVPFDDCEVPFDDPEVPFDVIVVGAGFAGLYALHRLRESGHRVRVYEAGDSVGGTWYWNRYPGARCDAESLAYSFSFSPELEQEWEWTERYAGQPEILRYIEHVTDRFELRQHIRFNRKVTSAHWDEHAREWRLTTDAGDTARAPVCIMATGCLSVPKVPDIPGIGDYEGPKYLTGRWPHEGVDFSGLRVGIVGTGSSAIQAIPVIAEQAEHLTVFQRTPNFSIPAHNRPLDPDFARAYKEHYREHRRLYQLGLSSGFGDTQIQPSPGGPAAEQVMALDDADFERICDDYWATGGARFTGAIADTLINEAANARVSAYVHKKIRSIVRDPKTADALCPHSHPLGTKRICVDTNYFETYNRANVSLVDLQETPIETANPTGLRTTADSYAFDALVLATGFDAMTGALLGMDIRGEGDVALADAWAEGPRAYLGLMVSGFPNLFTVTGPGSPSVLSNMLVSIEQHIEFILDVMAAMAERDATQVDAEAEAQEAWVAHVREVADATLMPKAGSWYMGANVPGKPRVFMPYAAGVGVYREVCEDVAANGFRGFRFDAPTPAGN